MAELLTLVRTTTAAQLLERDDFAKRWSAKEPISLLELLYPLLQAYDSVATDADVELGGTDQKFNLLLGRDIQRAYGKPEQAIVTMPLLVGIEGDRKMSKSLGNQIGITDAPQEIYGKTMSIPDQLIEKYVRLISGFDEKQQAEVLEMKPRDAKAALARQLVKRLRGEEAARRAEEDFDLKFRQHSTPEDVPERVATMPDDLLATLVEVGFAKSRGDARRLVEQGGIRINGEKAAESAALKNGDVLQAGKRNFVRIRLK